MTAIAAERARAANAQATAHAPQRSTVDELVENTIKRRQGIVDGAAAVLGVHPSKVLDLLRNVWKTSKGQPPLTDQEMFQGLSMVARYELDPIAREVYVTRTSQGLATIVGIDGWIKIVDRTDHYDGHEQEMHFDEEGNIVWVETIIHSKKRKFPTRYKAFAKEYSALAGFMANKIPLHMLRLFSFRHAARFFTPLGGTVMTEEEARYMQQFAPERKESAADILDSIAQPQEEVATEESEPQPEKQQTEAPPKPTKPSRAKDDAEMKPLAQLQADLNACKTIQDYERIERKWRDATFPGDEGLQADIAMREAKERLG